MLLRRLLEVKRCEEARRIPDTALDERIDSVGDAAAFFTLNGKSGCWEVKIEKEN